MRQRDQWLLTPALPRHLRFSRGGQPRHTSAMGGQRVSELVSGLWSKPRDEMLCASGKVFLTFKTAFDQNGERFTVLSSLTAVPMSFHTVPQLCAHKGNNKYKNKQHSDIFFLILPGTVSISIFISPVVKGILPSQQFEAGRLWPLVFRARVKKRVTATSIRFCSERRCLKEWCKGTG